MGRKHGGENRFRFQTFGERIAAIRIGANVKIKRFESIPDDAETFLGENLHRWATINCSNEFSSFECQVTPISESLPLVYLHRQKIANLFLSHLASATKLSLETLLDLLVHFARDLSSEFVPFAQDFVRTLVQISLTGKKEPDVLEWTFSCLAHLMKLLWKFFSEHLEAFFDIMLPTFEANMPAYLRQFSAEAFAFLVRKSNDLLGTIRMIVDSKLRAHPECSYGFGIVIFEVVRGANKTLLPCTEEVVKLLIELCLKEDAESPQTEIFQIFLNSCAEHIATPSAGVIFKQLLSLLQSTASANSCVSVAHAQTFFSTWITFRGGMFCCDANAVAKAVVDSMAWHHGHENCVDNLLSIFSSVVGLENNSLPAMQCYVHVKNLFDLPLSKAKLFDFALEHVASPLFTQSFLPHILSFLQKSKAKENVEKSSSSSDRRSSPEEFDMCDIVECEGEEKANEDDFVQESLLVILTKLALQRQQSSEEPSSRKTASPTAVSLPDAVIKQFASIVESKIHGAFSQHGEDLSQIWAIATITNKFHMLESDRDSTTLLLNAFTKFCSAARTNLASKTASDKKFANKILVTFKEVANCLITKGKTVFEQSTGLTCSYAMSLLSDYPNNLLSLLLAKTVIEACIDDEFEKNLGESERAYKELARLLEHHLANPVSEMRDASLCILEKASWAIYNAHAKALAEASKNSEKPTKPGVNVLSALLSAERTPPTLQLFKERLNFFQKIRADIIGNQPPAIDWQRLCIFSLVGQLTIDFTAMHKPINEFLANYVENLPREQFWSVFSHLLNETHERATNPVEYDEDDEDGSESRSCADLLIGATKELDKKPRVTVWNTLRVRLWEALRSFRIEDLEPNSRYFVPVFLDFVSNSFSNIVSSVSVPLVNLVIAPSSEKRLRRQAAGSFGERRHCLVTMLNVFSKLRHRSQLISADKIVAAVFRLLKQPRPELQQPALEFLINTNWPGIAAYKDNLTNLLEPKKYRGSLVEFGDLSTLSEADRKNLLPILLRLVFGQMHYTKNKKRSGKTGYAKKSASLAFLANISASEVCIFVEIMLESFAASPKWFQQVFSIQSNDDFVEAALQDGVDPMAFPSTEVQFWFFHTFVDAINNLHNIAADQWRLFFRIAVILYAMTMKVLTTNETELDGEHRKRLKRLRKLAFKSFSTYFARRGDTFDEWNCSKTLDEFDCVEVDAFFTHVIWPEFQRCGALTSGSELLPLLTLATVWASDSTLKHLLLKTSGNATLMSMIFDSIRATKTSTTDTGVDLTIADGYMKFFEKLLPERNPDAMEVDDQEEAAVDERFANSVYGHRSVIIGMVSNILTSSKKNKLVKKRVPKALDIFQRVTAKVDDPHCAAEVFQLLLSMLSSNSLPMGESQFSALKTLVEVIPVLESVTPSQLNMLAMCFSRTIDRKCRNQLCAVLEALTTRLVPHCARISSLILKLNSWNRKLVDEPDFEQRLSAFGESTRLLKEDDESFSVLDITFLLNNCLHFLLSVEDFSIRANSSELVTAIIHWAGRAIKAGTSSSSERKLIVNAIISASSRGVQHKNEVVRHEFLSILSQLVRTFPDHAALTGLSQLTDKDADADFFENMRHVQLHRRARAIRRLAALLQEQKPEDESDTSIGIRPLTNFILPLAQMYLISAVSGNVKASIVDASLELLRACCRHLPWPPYHRLLSKFLSQLLAGSNEKITFNIRAVVAILDSYHFVSFASKFDANSQMEVDTIEPKLVLAPKQKDERPDSDMAVLRAVQGQVIPNIIEAVNAQLLPGSLETGQCAVIPLTIAAVRLLIHCPTAFRTATVPSIVLKLVEFLKSRFLDVRQAARKSLSQICLALGPTQFGWIIRDLRISLTRGYQRHVLTYTIGELVRTVQPEFQPGQIDTCIKELTTIFCTELFSALSEEKEADCKVAGKCPEARRRASIHAYPVLANLVSRASVDTFLHPLREILVTSTDSEKIRKCRQVLHLVVPILAQNPGISLSDLVSLARRWLQGTRLESTERTANKKKNQPEPESGLLEPRPQPAQLLPPKPARMGQAMPSVSASTNSYIVSEFGLRLLFSLIKHNRLGDSSVVAAFEGNDAALEAFAGEIHSLMRLGENEAVLHAALSLASCLLTFKVPAFTKRLSTLADSVFELLKAELLQKNTQSRLLVACFKAAGILVELARSDDATKQSQGRVGLDSEQIDALLVCIDEALLGDRQGICALQLLKKLLDSSLKSQQLPEIINGTITKEALRGRDDHQPVARACILSYMLHYPVGPKSLEAMVETFIGVLAIENSEACVVRSALEMLFLIAAHFPQKEVERKCALIFLPVAALFINSKDVEVRELVNVVLVRLLSRVSQASRDAVYKDLVLPWLTSGKLLRQQLASHVVAVFIEAEHEKFEPRLANTMPALVDLIVEKLPETKQTKAKEDENEDDEGGNLMAETSCNEAPIDESLDGLLYSLSSTLVKLVRQFRLTAIGACSGGFSQIVSICSALALHAHSWIRFQIGYLWFELFQSVEPREFLRSSGISVKDEYQLKTLCRRIINQLLTKGISPEFSQTVAANYVFLSRVMLLNDSTDLLVWLCRRIVRIAMSESIYEAKLTCIKRLCIFKWMAAFVTDISTSKISKEMTATLVLILVVPLSRELKETPALASKGDDAENGENEDDEPGETFVREDPVSQELKPVCLELSDLFRKTFGVEMFTSALNASMKKAAEKKMQRTAERASLAVTDPARAARLKVLKQASKREAGKRRIVEDKTRRGVTVRKRSKRFDAENE